MLHFFEFCVIFRYHLSMLAKAPHARNGRVWTFLPLKDDILFHNIQSLRGLLWLLQRANMSLFPLCKIAISYSQLEYIHYTFHAFCDPMIFWYNEALY